MGFVYLIGEENEENKYKIGSTKCKDINKRLKQLQTGNSNKLILTNYFETSRPFKLETMLHYRYKEHNVIGEWFELSDDDIKDFVNECVQYQKIIDTLKENPYF